MHRGTDRTGEGHLARRPHRRSARRLCRARGSRTSRGSSCSAYSVGGHPSRCAPRSTRRSADLRRRRDLPAALDLDLRRTNLRRARAARHPPRSGSSARSTRSTPSTTPRKPLPVPLADVRRARSSRRREYLAIAPRFGFTSAGELLLARERHAPAPPRGAGAVRRGAPRSDRTAACDRTRARRRAPRDRRRQQGPRRTSLFRLLSVSGSATAPGITLHKIVTWLARA